jgi:hypothetical protein
MQSTAPGARRWFACHQQARSVGRPGAVSAAQNGTTVVGVAAAHHAIGLRLKYARASRDRGGRRDQRGTTNRCAALRKRRAPGAVDEHVLRTGIVTLKEQLTAFTSTRFDNVTLQQLQEQLTAHDALRAVSSNSSRPRFSWPSVGNRKGPDVGRSKGVEQPQPQ